MAVPSTLGKAHRDAHAVERPCTGFPDCHAHAYGGVVGNHARMDGNNSFTNPNTNPSAVR